MGAKVSRCVEFLFMCDLAFMTCLCNDRTFLFKEMTSRIYFGLVALKKDGMPLYYFIR